MQLQAHVDVTRVAFRGQTPFAQGVRVARLMELTPAALRLLPAPGGMGFVLAWGQIGAVQQLERELALVEPSGKWLAGIVILETQTHIMQIYSLINRFLMAYRDVPNVEARMDARLSFLRSECTHRDGG